MTKAPLILIPGLLCDSDIWADQCASLTKISEIFITDQQVNFESVEKIAKAILETAPAHFNLAGFSMGGYVSLEIMRQAPDRVLRLALLDTSARADSEIQTNRRRDLIALANKGRFKGVTPQLMPLLVHPTRLNDQPLTDRITTMAINVGRDGFLRQQTAIMARPDSRAGLSQIKCPTLVLCGDDDRLTPPDVSQEMAAAIPGAELVMIAPSGHMAPMEQPDAVTAALLQWLTRPIG